MLDSRRARWLKRVGIHTRLDSRFQVLMPRRAMTRTDDFCWWDMAAMGFHVKALEVWSAFKYASNIFKQILPTLSILIKHCDNISGFFYHQRRRYCNILQYTAIWMHILHISCLAGSGAFGPALSGSFCGSLGCSEVHIWNYSKFRLNQLDGYDSYIYNI